MDNQSSSSLASLLLKHEEEAETMATTREVEDQTKISYPVHLNVYDSTKFNSYIRWLSLGFYHSSIQVHGQEYMFIDPDGVISGNQNNLRLCRGLTLRHTIHVGSTHLDPGQVAAAVEELKSRFPGNMYDTVHNNSNNFSDLLSDTLTGNQIPSWVNHSAKYGRFCSCIMWLFDRQAPAQVDSHDDPDGDQVDHPADPNVTAESGDLDGSNVDTPAEGDHPAQFDDQLHADPNANPLAQVDRGADPNVNPLAQVDNLDDPGVRPLAEVDVVADGHDDSNAAAEVADRDDPNVETPAQVDCRDDSDVDPPAKVVSPANSTVKPPAKGDAPANSTVEPPAKANNPADSNVKPPSEVDDPANSTVGSQVDDHADSNVAANVDDRDDSDVEL